MGREKRKGRLVNDQNQANIDQMQERMQEIETKSKSQSMCLAKWMQSTVYLMNGQTHSCHHPPVHHIPAQELKNNPGALHNTQYKLKQREAMLSGARPAECQYCWNIEDLGKNFISDRVYKSTDKNWSYPHLNRVLESKTGAKILPSYLEVAFENTCNMKCMYCTPDISSKWMEEIKNFGPYLNTSQQVGNLEWLKNSNKMPIPATENNPYIEAFWQWWPELYNNLHTFRITGGEPLLSKNTWRVLDEVQMQPRSSFNLAINSNFQVPEAMFDKFIKQYSAIAPHINSFDVFTSCEAFGEQSEYIRTGMNYSLLLKNIRKFLENTPKTSRVGLMITFNVLSLSTFDLFMKDVLQIRDEFNETAEFNRLPMMINYLRWPEFQDVRMASVTAKQKYFDKIKQTLEFGLKKNSPGSLGLFYLEEKDQIERLGQYMMQEMPDLEKHRNDFKSFFQEYDRRRKTDFLSIFPEHQALYNGEELS